jgi:hypothetical protein
MSDVPTFSAGRNQVLVGENENERNQVTIVEQPTEVLVSLFGVQGARGSTFISGEGPPAESVGIQGDVYIDVVRNAFWGPKTAEQGWGPDPFYIAGRVSRFVFVQQQASDEWLIDHELGGRPSVTVVDSASTAVIGEVSYISDSRVIARFTSPFSGFAYLT